MSAPRVEPPTFTVERLNDAGTFEPFKVGVGRDALEAVRACYLPLGWGGHGRSDRSLEAIARGETVTTPLGTYRLAGSEASA